VPLAPLTQPAAEAPPIAVIDWLGLHLELPRNWEIVRHSTSQRKGSLVFADRTHQRLQVTWTACAKPPDVARLLADHRARQCEQDADARFEPPALPAGWRGLTRLQDDGRSLTRAARFDTKTSRLIEAVFDAEPCRADAQALADQVLTPLRITHPADDAPRFRAFGLDVEVSKPRAEGRNAPHAWQITEAKILPADITLRWEPSAEAGKKHRDSQYTVRRRAMADVWFDNNLRRLLQAESPRTAMSFTPAAVNSHPAQQATWVVPGPRYQRLLSQHHLAVAVAWHCPRDNAVYLSFATGRAKSSPSLAGWAVRCGQGCCDA